MANENTTPDFFLQAIEVERIVNVHRVTLLRWAAKNLAPKPQKICGRWFWRNSEIEQFIAGEWEAK